MAKFTNFVKNYGIVTDVVKSILNLSSVCLSDVCLLLKVLPVNTTQYLHQIKSEPHETFSVCQDWSPELINKVCTRAR